MTTRKRSTTKKKSPVRKTSTTSRPQAAEPVPEPAEETAIAETEARTEVATVVTVVPEPAFAARMAPPPPPRPRPDQRRGIFFDVENTSRPQDIEFVLRHLMIDRVGIDTDFTAVGNWRVIGHETARLLAHTGAHLVHSAPSVGVRDWSDLRIAVAAGVWLASARPGDMIDVVSDDQAFDAVGDVAASLGVQYRRLSYRSFTGRVAAERTETAPAEARSRRRGRGGRGRRGGERQAEVARTRHQAPLPARVHAAAHPIRSHAPVTEPAEADSEGHTAPHDELIDVVRDLMVSSPAGVTLDQLANGLRERGFRRTPGSPRLITRLKRIKELDVSRNGMIRLADGTSGEPAAAARAIVIDPGDIETETEARADGGDEDEVTTDSAEASGPETAAGGERRRRRRRGGRRRRGRRGGGGGGGNASTEGSVDVVAAAAPATLET